MTVYVCMHPPTCTVMVYSILKIHAVLVLYTYFGPDELTNTTLPAYQILSTFHAEF